MFPFLGKFYSFFCLAVLFLFCGFMLALTISTKEASVVAIPTDEF